MLSKEHMYMKMYTKVHIVNFSAHVSKSAWKCAHVQAHACPAPLAPN